MPAAPKHKVNSLYMRVTRGAKWLDENFPGWEDRINIETLDLEQGVVCICGQVFKEEAKATNENGDDVYSDGYQYAELNLLPQANAWISRLVKIQNDEGRVRPMTGAQRLGRAKKVAEQLGFLLEPGGDYGDLTDVWAAFLEFRLAAKLVAS